MLDRNKYSSFRLFLVALTVLIVFMHAPGLFAGRLLDDIIVLDKCENLPWKSLLTNGFRFQREELGNVWWIDQETILCYFRPLLLATFRLPMMLGGSVDFLQHAINVTLHLAMSGLVLVFGRHVFKNSRSAFLAALFFAVSLHDRWAILMITARKELLVGLLLLSALYLHIRWRQWWAALSFAGALLAGEHAVVFPILAFFWDMFAPTSEARDSTPAAPVRRGWPCWVGYLGILAIYAVVRFFALSGLPLPIQPYFNAPQSPGFIPFTILKSLVMVFSLTSTIPFVDRPIIEFWLNHPLFFALCVVSSALIITLLLVAAKDRRLCLLFLICSAVAYLPFVPMAALPFYLYMPSVFYALAIGAALDGTKAVGAKTWTPSRSFLTLLVIAGMAVNISATIILNWGPARTPFDPGVDSPQKIAEAVARLLENEPPDRKIIFVDAPSPPPFFYFTYLLAGNTGRDPDDLAVVTCAPRAKSEQESRVTALEPSSLLIESTERPYFSKPVTKLMWFFPEGLIAAGRSFARPWFTVTIESVGQPPRPTDRGRVFFSEEPGITALSIKVNPNVPPPLVVGFHGHEPTILLDMSRKAEERRPCAEPSRSLLSSSVSKW